MRGVHRMAQERSGDAPRFLGQEREFFATLEDFFAQAFNARLGNVMLGRAQLLVGFVTHGMIAHGSSLKAASETQWQLEPYSIPIQSDQACSQRTNLKSRAMAKQCPKVKANPRVEQQDKALDLPFAFRHLPFAIPPVNLDLA
jgi:hypothetical protein